MVNNGVTQLCEKILATPLHASNCIRPCVWVGLWPWHWLCRWLFYPMPFDSGWLIVWPGYRPKRTAFRRILAGDVTRLQSVQHRIMNWMRASLQPHATRTVYCIGSPIYKLCKRHSNAITDRKWDGCWVTPCICSPQLVFAETYLLFACQNLRCAY